MPSDRLTAALGGMEVVDKNGGKWVLDVPSRSEQYAAVLALIGSEECRETVMHPPCIVVGGGGSCAPGRPDRKHPECAIAAIAAYLTGDADG